ncbi:hypothetical protein ACFXOY_01380 [Streptomyces niveus]|uniref:hypothetical protein n=1 Tax=Streptomyces niveus TaxID=193462 RepID=UPI0036C2B310
MTTRTRTHRILCAAVAGALALLASGCSDDPDGKPADVSVTADKLCGGGVVTKDAAKAIELITRETRFIASGENSTVTDAAEELTREAITSTNERGDICRIYPYAPVDELRMRWVLMSNAPTGTPDPKFTRLPMGERAGAAHDTAYVTFACGHKNQPDSSPDYISAWAEATGRPTEPEGDERPLKNAYATLAHSFALAMAKELNCDDNGGLKPEPSLIPAT